VIYISLIEILDPVFARDALSALKGALASVGADKFRASIVDVLPESPFNITKVAGTALTGRDWSGDFAKLQNLDTALSTRASESTLSGIKTQTDKLTFDASNYLQVNVKATVNPSNLDVALSTRASESTLSAIKNALASVGTDKMRVSVIDSLPAGTNKIGSVDVATIPVTKGDWLSAIPNPSNLDVALSTRASESTLSGIKSQTDKLTFDTSSYLQVNVKSTVNPSNLDVALSTRASESTLSAIKSKTDNLDVALSTRASETTLSGIKSQTDKLSFDTSNRLAIQNPPNMDVAPINKSK